MNRQKRSSLVGIFPNLKLDSPSRSTTQTTLPVNPSSFRASISKTFQKNWPRWTLAKTGKELNFTFKISDLYRQMGDSSEVKANFEATQASFERISKNFAQQTLDPNEKMFEWIESSMIEAIFGSNAIERAGHGFDFTLDICKRIFRGQEVPDTIDPREPEYERGLKDLTRQNMLKAGENQVKVVLRSRKEVIQHAKAMEHIVSAIVYKDEPLTEQLILETHAILCKGVENDDGTPADQYAGKYRHDDVAVQHKNAKRPHRFIHPSSVPTFMARMCERYQTELEEMENNEAIDPFMFASKYSHIFVNIHPFADGNGRMCRLILYAILLKYLGTCIPIGEEGDDSRQEYLDIMNKGNKEFLDEDYTDYRESGHENLAALILRKATLKFENFVSTLKGKDRQVEVASGQNPQDEHVEQ
ncbi:MAG: hypothetical protein Q9219_006918 [cf. Caloplaca sp. 3 TL-2023]